MRFVTLFIIKKLTGMSKQNSVLISYLAPWLSCTRFETWEFHGVSLGSLFTLRSAPMDPFAMIKTVRTLTLRHHNFQKLLKKGKKKSMNTDKLCLKNTTKTKAICLRFIETKKGITWFSRDKKKPSPNSNDLKPSSSSTQVRTRKSELKPCSEQPNHTCTHRQTIIF